MAYGWHVCGPSTNSYMRWEEESEKRHKHGEIQLQCGGCGKWYWPKWEEDVAQHADCKAPSCQKCKCRDLITVTKQISRRDAIVTGFRCVKCGHVNTFKEAAP